MLYILCQNILTLHFIIAVKNVFEPFVCKMKFSTHQPTIDTRVSEKKTVKKNVVLFCKFLFWVFTCKYGVFVILSL